MEYATVVRQYLKKQAASGLAAVMLLFVSLSVNAVMISVSPSTQTVNVGDSVFVDVIASGLGTGTAPSIGAFDLDVLFDSAILSASTVTFGSGLDVLGLGSLQGVFGANPVNVFEVSFDTVADLDALQPDTFLLFTIGFNAIAQGVSDIDLFINDVSDAEGNTLAVDTVSGEINVERAQGVPTPATLMLLGLGLAALGFSRKKVSQA
ncbi:MAG: PEP-CTERM sorting domain-containing protein [Pseudomonadales bacterium]|nr:PEP-CTERM sorting domain-containing protein [Halioglobus sp.]MCP5130392.1 PEP-CTERM sorting domain-containing protein [Pseudomonadales bacterium]